MIKDVGKSVGGAIMETVGRAVGRAQEKRPLPVDLLESDDAFLAVFDAPGAQSTDVQVRFEDGAIIVRVDRFREFYDGFEMQFPGRGLSLDGRVKLPDDATVDPEKADATLKDNGTLHVRVPKVEAEKTGTTKEQNVDKTTGSDITGDEAAGGGITGGESADHSMAGDDYPGDED